MRYHEGLHGFPEEALHKVTFGRTVLAASEDEHARSWPASSQIATAAPEKLLAH